MAWKLPAIILRFFYRKMLIKRYSKRFQNKPGILISDSQLPFHNLFLATSSDKANSCFYHENNNIFHIEQVIRLSGNIQIDPVSGFVFDGNTCFVYPQSIPYDHPSRYPPFFRSLGKNIIKLENPILFDHFWGLEYFHFFADVISKLWLIDKYSEMIGQSPLLISRKSFNSKVFQFFFQFPAISERNWFIQEESDVISSCSATILMPWQYCAAYWKQTSYLVDHCKAKRAYGKHIFINRPRDAGRYIINFEEIEPILRKHCVEVYELDHLPLAQQIKLFSSAQSVTAIHGAALSNIVWSHQGLKVLEIIPCDYVMPHYYWLSTVLGHSYNCLLSKTSFPKSLTVPRSCFVVCPIEFEKALVEMIED